MSTPKISECLQTDQQENEKQLFRRDAHPILSDWVNMRRLQKQTDHLMDKYWFGKKWRLIWSGRLWNERRRWMGITRCAAVTRQSSPATDENKKLISLKIRCQLNQLVVHWPNTLEIVAVSRFVQRFCFQLPRNLVVLCYCCFRFSFFGMNRATCDHFTLAGRPTAYRTTEYTRKIHENVGNEKNAFVLLAEHSLRTFRV